MDDYGQLLHQLGLQVGLTGLGSALGKCIGPLWLGKEKQQQQDVRTIRIPLLGVSTFKHETRNELCLMQAFYPAFLT